MFVTLKPSEILLIFNGLCRDRSNSTSGSENGYHGSAIKYNGVWAKARCLSQADRN